MAPVAVIIVLFSALRLAKFNIDENQTSEFIGMPTPANALFFASIGWVFSNGLQLSIESEWALFGMTILMSSFLISNTIMFSLKFKSYAIKDNYMRYSFLLGSLIALVIWQISAIPLIIVAYITVSIFTKLATQVKGK